jgi:trehalose 6-phosphate phosphatase
VIESSEVVVRHLFSKSGLGVLERFARLNALVALDYDGTLAPIVPDPHGAAMRRSTRWLLEDLAELRPCIVVSSRPQADIIPRLRGIALREIVGNYGVERLSGATRFAEEVRSWGPILEAHLSGRSGVSIENKVFSVAVHYRRARDKRRSLAAIHAAVRGLSARVVSGKDIVNLLPYGAPHKGIALEMAVKRLECGSAIYVGDDESDEDAFRTGDAARLLTVRIGEHEASRAAFCLRDQDEIDELLRYLIHAAIDRDEAP